MKNVLILPYAALILMINAVLVLLGHGHKGTLCRKRRLRIGTIPQLMS